MIQSDLQTGEPYEINVSGRKLRAIYKGFRNGNYVFTSNNTYYRIKSLSNIKEYK